MTYTGFKGLTLRGGLINLFDQDPPFSNQSGRFQARSYDDRFCSPLGRVYTLLPATSSSSHQAFFRNGCPCGIRFFCAAIELLAEYLLAE